MHSAAPIAQYMAASTRWVNRSQFTYEQTIPADVIRNVTERERVHWCSVFVCVPLYEHMLRLAPAQYFKAELEHFSISYCMDIWNADCLLQTTVSATDTHSRHSTNNPYSVYTKRSLFNYCIHACSSANIMLYATCSLQCFRILHSFPHWATLVLQF